MKEDLFNFPNTLTLARIFVVPIMVVVFLLPWQYAREAAAIIFVMASITDWLDGYIARACNLETKVGALIDPVADKIIVVATLIMLVKDQNSNLFLIGTIVLILREIIVSLFREWVHSTTTSSLKVSIFGKVKTACQMMSIPFLLWFEPNTTWNYVGLAGLYVSVVMSLWSFYTYFLKLKESLVEKNEV